MSLPKRNEREYLEIRDSEGGFSIAVKLDHADQLSTLLTQRGFTHERRNGVDSPELFFTADTDKRKVAEVLDSHKNVKGS